MRALLIRGTVLAASLLIAPYALSWVRDGGPLWPNGTITLHLQLGNSPTYSDGSNPNSTGVAALEAWNPYMGRVQLAANVGSGAAKKLNNSINNVFFAADMYGKSFGENVLAVAMSSFSGSRRTECDVIVSTAHTWDAYRGSLRLKPDLRRVLMHEFGHVLGLGHPDEESQYVEALMNSHISYVDSLTQDDQDGVGSLYGRGIANPATAPTLSSFEPYDVTVDYGRDVGLSVSIVDGTPPFSFQWKKNGTAIPGATDSSLYLARARTADAGKYSVVVSNDAGSATSREATVTVNPPVPLKFTHEPQDRVAVEGTWVDLSVGVVGSPPITFQWQKDGVDMPGVTNSSFFISSVAPTDAGRYRVRVSNDLESITSREAVLTIIPADPPVIIEHPRNTSVPLGETATFGVQAQSNVPIHFQWLKNGQPIPHAAYPFLSVSALSAFDEAAYSVTCSTSGGSVTSNSARLTIIAPPALDPLLLTNRSVIAGERVDFSSYSFEGPLRFQWYHNGQPIPGATHFHHDIPSASDADAGEYFVVMRNAGATTTSTTALLSVIHPPAAQTGAWLQRLRHGAIAHFLFQNPARVERFDLAADVFLPAIQLSRTPSAMAIHGGTIYVAYENQIVRRDTSGTGETTFATLTHPVHELLANDGYLYALTGTDYDYRLVSFSRESGQVTAELTFLPRPESRMSLAPNFGGIYFQWAGNLVHVPLEPDGTFGLWRDSSNTEAFYPAQRTFVAPDGAWVAADSGTAYSTDDLNLLGSFGGPLTDLDFTSDGGSLILRERDRVIAFSDRFAEGKSLTLAQPADAIFAFGDEVFAFTAPVEAGAPIFRQRVSLEKLAAASPAPARDATGLAFTPDGIWLDRDGVVLLYSRVHRNIFRWSPAEHRYLEPIRLLGAPNFVDYAPELHALFLGYPNQQVRRLDLGGDFSERSILAAPTGMLGLAAAGEHIFLADPAGAWESFLTYDAEGAQLSRVEWQHRSRSYVWDPVRRRIYHFRDSTSPNDLHYVVLEDDGTLGAVGETPYHGEVVTRLPIRVSPNGDQVLLGDGSFYNASDLTRSNALPDAFDDATWLGDTLFTARTNIRGAEIQRWSGGNYSRDASTILPDCRLLRILPLDEERLLAITSKYDLVEFTVLDAQLRVLSHDGAPDGSLSRLINLSTRAHVGTGADILIAGFVVSGDAPKRMLIRGIGPTLQAHGVTGPLADPVLRIYDRHGVALAENDNWDDGAGLEKRQAFADAYAFKLPHGSLDAALVETLAPGNYTAHLFGKGNSTGVGLVEVYDLEADDTKNVRLLNISSRAFVGQDESVLIGGLVIHGPNPKRVLLRAVGPSLTSLGLTDVLWDPRLAILDAGGGVIAGNDNWGSEDRFVIQKAGFLTYAFPLSIGSTDAAMVYLLAPGLYTVQVSGVNGSSGVALIEAYELP